MRMPMHRILDNVLALKIQKQKWRPTHRTPCDLPFFNENLRQSTQAESYIQGTTPDGIKQDTIQCTGQFTLITSQLRSTGVQKYRIISKSISNKAPVSDCPNLNRSILKLQCFPKEATYGVQCVYNIGYCFSVTLTQSVCQYVSKAQFNKAQSLSQQSSELRSHRSPVHTHFEGPQWTVDPLWIHTRFEGTLSQFSNLPKLLI